MCFMKKQIEILTLFFGFCCSFMFGQNSYENKTSVRDFNKGVTAFENEDYFLALRYFNATVSEEESSKQAIQKMQFISALETEQPDANIDLEEYLETHPHTIYKTELYLALANFYFKKRKTKKAFRLFKNIDVKELSDHQEQNYNYKLAFASYTAKNYLKAKEYLLPLANEGAFKNEANYYLANIALQTKDFNTAKKYLTNIKDVEKYQKIYAYQNLVILYQQKKDQEAALFGTSNFEEAQGLEKSEMAKIIGESYFHLEDYKRAVAYLSKYKGRRNKFTEVDYYFLGFANYKVKDYKQAIQSFNKITDQRNEVAQNAHYHLADCYLKLNQKTQALNAFKNASEMDFNIDVQQDAYLNYAKLGYEIGNPYQNSSEVLQRFIDKYPNAPEVPSLKGLIINAYLYYKDYEGAISYYKTNRVPKDIQYQQVLVQKGFELFYSAKFQKALPYFTEASDLFLDTKTKVQALFWKAETLAELQNYIEASYAYTSFVTNNEAKQLEEYSDGVYGLGYALFQQKKYAKALPYFEQYVAVSKHAAKKNNALLRIADCNFVNKQYNKAITAYTNVVNQNSSQVDYAMYQKALAYGFLGEKDEKRSVLEALQNKFKTSAYLDKSYYQLGNLWTSKNKQENALTAYNYLIDNFKNSPLLAKAELKKGLLYYNQGENRKSIAALKNVVANYPGSSEAVQAVKIAEQVYKDLDEVATYAAWVKKLEFVNISDADIDKTMFEAVENRFLANELQQTITSGKKYLINFPNGIHALTTHYYIAQSYFVTNNKQNAIPHYEYVVKGRINEYTNVSLNRLSQVYLENDDWELAKPLLERLEKESDNQQNKTYAQRNLMKYFFQNKSYAKVSEYTEKVLQNSGNSEQVTRDAYIFGARSAVLLKNIPTAKAYYQKLETLGKGEVLAEVNYYKALWLHQDKKYEKSNAEIQILASKHQKYKYWGVKGLVLMAQNFHALDDDFQANFILKNVLENASEYADVIDEATKLREEYKQEQNVITNENDL